MHARQKALHFKVLENNGSGVLPPLDTPTVEQSWAYERAVRAVGHVVLGCDDLEA